MKKSVFAVLIFLLVFSNAYAQSTQHDNLALTPGSGVLQNYTAGGTITAGHLLKTNGSGLVIETTTSDTGGFLGVAQASAVNGASVQVAIIGQVNMVTDGACAPANFISNSILTNGIGHCGTSAPTTQIGIAQASSGGPGTIKVALSIGQSSSAQISLPGVSVVSNKLINDNDFVPKGPNPYADVMRFGGYFGPQTPPSTTGSITSGAAILGLASAQDFANGQGILALGAGPATSLSTPTGVVAAPWGVTGATAYNYCVVGEDYFGGRTACSTAGASTTSAATLGINAATLSGCNRVSGITTCTTTGNHNFTAGAQVNIVKNSTSDTRFEGAFSIFATPTPTTFTYTQYGAMDATATGGSAQVNATNLVKWNSDATNNSVLRSYIYRCTASCGVIGPNYSIAGVAVGVDGYWQDYGFGTLVVASLGNGDVPLTAPTVATKDWLSTTILSGGGTTSLTLANNASTTVAAATVLHDNSPNLAAACASFTRGGIVYIPTSNVAANYFPINSTFKLSNCPAGTQLQINNKIFANASILIGNYQNIQGLPGGRDVSVSSPAFYDLRPTALIAGFAYPFIYIQPMLTGNFSLDDLLLACNQAYQNCIHQDQLTTGGSINGDRYRNVHANSGGVGNTPWVVKGGFGHTWEYGGWANGATTFAVPPGMLFSPNCGLGNTNQQQAYLVTTEYNYGFSGTVFDACNQPPQGLTNFVFRDMLGESGRVPMFRFANTGGVGAFSGNVAWWELTRTNYADSLAGIATPVMDATMVNQITGLRFISLGAPNGPLLETNSGGVTGVDVSADYIGIVGAQTYSISGLGNFANVPAKVSGALGHFAYQMALPSPLQSAVVSAGGAVPLTGGISNGPTHIYTIAMVDFSGNETTVSTGVNATVSGGNQTVTGTLPASFSSGAKGVNVYRDGARVQNGACGTSPQFTTPGGTFVDASAITCGNSAALVNAAGSAMIDANGLSGTLLTFTNNPRFKGTLTTGSLTGDRVVTMPDAAGVVLLDTATQTLTNKTLTSPTLNTPTVNTPALTTPTIGGGTTLTKYSRFSSAQTPALVAANTCAAQTFTVAGISASDILISISKPTEQAGLTVTPGHVTGTNAVTANFCNATAVGITPTAAETYQFVTVQ